MKKRQWLLIPLVNTGFLLLLYSTAFAQTEGNSSAGFWRKLFSGFHISPGVSVKSPTLRIERKSDDREADLTASPGDIAFHLDINFVDIPFGDHFGFSLFSHSSYFKLDHQFINTGETDEDGDAIVKKEKLGSQASGFYSYLIPAVYYRPYDGFKLGAGAGGGYLRVSGDAFFATDRLKSDLGASTKFSGTSGTAFSYLIFGEYDFLEHYQMRVSVGGPLFSDSEFSYRLEEFSLWLSRKIYF